MSYLNRYLDRPEVLVVGWAPAAGDRAPFDPHNVLYDPALARSGSFLAEQLAAAGLRSDQVGAVNVFAQPPPADAAAEARRAAAAAVREGHLRRRVVILAGQDVATAFGFGQELPCRLARVPEWRSWVGILPHPASSNPWWNDEQHRRQATTFLQGVRRALEDRAARTSRPLVGIHGAAGSGKDTAARILVEQARFLRVALADPIKRYAVDLFEYASEDLWGESGNRSAPAPIVHDPLARLFLQHEGTEGGRAVREDVWILYLLRVLDDIALEDWAYYPQIGVERARRTSRIDGFVVPDVRYANEAAAIRKLGGLVLRLVGRGSALPAGGLAGHCSEAGIPGDGRDAVIDNSGTVEQLQARLLDSLRRLPRAPDGLDKPRILA